MNYTITFEKCAVKFLRKQDSKQQEKILSAISQLPAGTDIKRLQGYNLYRLRVGNNIRVIYSVNEDTKTINIENIGNRGQIYNEY